MAVDSRNLSHKPGFFVALGGDRLSLNGGLVVHERAGGHTLARHVGITEASLVNRLVTQPTLPRASSFFNREIAEQTISDAMDANQTQIVNWLATATARLSIYHRVNQAIGISLAQNNLHPAIAQNLRIILKRDATVSLGYYILTAYPEP